MALLSIRRRFNLKSRLDREAAVVPEEFRCPISLEMMRDPVTAATGITYDRLSIEVWLGMDNSTCPVTGREIAGGVEGELVPNHTLRKMIQDWCVANRSLGVERIPTPKIPVTDADVAGALSEIAAASRRGEGPRCARVAARVRRWARESERNRVRILSHGACAALVVALCAVATEHAEEILAALAAISPLDEVAARAAAASPAALRFLARTLKQGTTLAARGNAAWMLRQMVAASRGGGWRAVAETEGMVEALAETVRRPVSSAATKAALVCIMQAARGSEAAAGRAVEAGAVEAAVEMAAEAGDRSTCEKALGALEAMARWEVGRRRARGHALAVPVLAKKMFRVSELATELAVSALLRLCSGGGDEEEERRRCAVEAVESGAFQKLLLLLQVGCSDEAREGATNLLRLLNGYRQRNECVDSMDLKGLKRPI
ncbi:U-box domain-containing protein 21-like [Zingiber officinale]|uniref:U-box domain-containing protein n=1 Tax=Zingiber officinale TaxID=94328 RepID=A0A8J5F0W2_ZINOF|nr:U-box domain-containing protein 21-like [Zingiber officinale]KAG6477455.1 hypothetical protein ZIOFF_066710 [Zingiber officinale]